MNRQPRNAESNRAQSSSMATNANQQYQYNMENAAMEARLAYETRSIVENIRSVNTIYAYKPKQEKFKQWCIEKNYPNDLVTEMKVVWYVRELFDRGIQSTATNVDGTTTTVRIAYSHETLKMHIKALVDLYNKQKIEYQGVMDLKHPRGESLKNYEKSLRRLCSEARRTEDFIDPGIGSIQDGYNAEQLIQVADYYLERKKMAGDALRDRMMFLLNHMMMLRGETLRETNFNHMFSLEFKDEGATRCPVFVMMITGGKTNQEHHKLYSGAIRHKNVQTCAFGAVGFYLFHRFHIKGEAFPDFSSNENWFNTKLARGRKIDKSICYNTQFNSITNAFAAVGVNSAKKAHTGRVAGAREAEMAALSHVHIRRVGRWNSESIENNYLTCLPRTAMRVIQGFPEERGCFWLPRALVVPPLSLQQMVFPWVEEWQQRMQTDPSIQTICGKGFLKLLVELRTIILQDAVLLKQLVSTHEMFNHAVFKSREFLLFADELIRTMNNTTPPAEVEMQRVAPEMHSRMTDMGIQIQALQRAEGSRTVTMSREDVEAIADRVMEEIEEKFGAALANNSVTVQQLTEGAITSTTEVVSTLAGTRRRRDDEDDQRKRYKLSRDLTNVTSLWKEWTVGLSEGEPSFNYLNEKYGTKWKQESKERRYYSKRFEIIREIKKVADRRKIPLEDAVEVVENERIVSLKGCSLDKLSKTINARNKQEQEQEQVQQEQAQQNEQNEQNEEEEE